MNQHHIVPIQNIAEAKKLQELSIHTFRENYEHKNDPDNFQGYIIQAFNLIQLEKEILHPESFFYLLYFFNNTLAGYFKLNVGSTQTDQQCPEALEIERIYLLKPFQGKGLGRAMIDYTLEKARELNKPYIWLGVWKQNPDAIAFYKRMGFVYFGNHTFTIGTEDQEDELYLLEV